MQFQEGDYQKDIKVSELCEETASLYSNPADWHMLCQQFGIGDKAAAAVKDLSGGERQRLFIVLALIGQPELVFLDELTTGLNAKARRSTWKNLEKLKRQGLTMMKNTFLGISTESILLPICVMVGVTVLCTTLAICFFRWE